MKFLTEHELSRIAADATQEVLEETYGRQQQYQNALGTPSKADLIESEWEALDTVSPGWNVYSDPIEIGTGGRRRKRMR